MIDRCLRPRLGREALCRVEIGHNSGPHLNRILGGIPAVVVTHGVMEELDGIFLDPECFVGPPTIKILEGDIILQDPTVPWHFAETVAVSTRENRQIFAPRMGCSAIIVKISGISIVSA